MQAARCHIPLLLTKLCVVSDEGALESGSYPALLDNIYRGRHKVEDIARRAERRMPHYAERAVGSVVRDRAKVAVKGRFLEARSFQDFFEPRRGRPVERRRRTPQLKRDRPPGGGRRSGTSPSTNRSAPGDGPKRPTAAQAQSSGRTEEARRAW
jgi:hypothetical protein